MAIQGARVISSSAGRHARASFWRCQDSRCWSLSKGTLQLLIANTSPTPDQHFAMPVVQSFVLCRRDAGGKGHGGDKGGDFNYMSLTVESLPFACWLPKQCPPITLLPGSDDCHTCPMHIYRSGRTRKPSTTGVHRIALARHMEATPPRRSPICQCFLALHPWHAMRVH